MIDIMYNVVLVCNSSKTEVVFRKTLSKSHFSIVYPRYKKELKLDRDGLFYARLESHCEEGNQEALKLLLLNALKRLLNQKYQEIQRMKRHKNTTSYKNSI
jgi:hypothetical protein